MAYKRLDRRFSEDSPPAQEITSLRSDPPLCCYGQAGRLPRSWAHHWQGPALPELRSKRSPYTIWAYIQRPQDCHAACDIAEIAISPTGFFGSTTVSRYELALRSRLMAYTSAPTRSSSMPWRSSKACDSKQ